MKNPMKENKVFENILLILILTLSLSAKESISAINRKLWREYIRIESTDSLFKILRMEYEKLNEITMNVKTEQEFISLINYDRHYKMQLLSRIIKNLYKLNPKLECCKNTLTAWYELNGADAIFNQYYQTNIERDDRWKSDVVFMALRSFNKANETLKQTSKEQLENCQSVRFCDSIFTVVECGIIRSEVKALFVVTELLGNYVLLDTISKESFGACKDQIIEFLNKIENFTVCCHCYVSDEKSDIEMKISEIKNKLIFRK